MSLPPQSVPPAPATDLPSLPAQPGSPRGPLDGRTANGSTFSLQSARSRVGKVRHWSKRTKLLVSGLIGLVAVVVLGGAYVLIERPFQKTWDNLVTHEVRYGRLELTIVERGQLESATNSDVYCRVKAR